MPNSRENAQNQTVLMGAYFSPDLPLVIKQQMQEGLFPVQIRCDIRGETFVHAQEILSDFIYTQVKKNRLNALVYFDDENRALSHALLPWLSHHPDVLAIHPASPADGGVGALYVFLKKRVGDLARPDDGSFLVDETQSMENQRRLAEQKGMRKYAKVNQRERADHTQEAGNELNMQGPKQHPYLQSQRFDGIDPNVNPTPDIGTDARREFDNELRNQEQEKQLRLGHMPKPTAPEPKPR